jgi:hypothetical protein
MTMSTIEAGRLDGSLASVGFAADCKRCYGQSPGAARGAGP